MKNNQNKSNSSIGTKITINHEGDFPTILKEIKLNDLFQGHEQELFEYIDIYINQLSNIEIKIPKIIKQSYKKNTLIFLCEYAGESILDLMNSEVLEDTIQKTSIFDQILDMLQIIQKGKLYFDPHPKNYVLENNALSYIDFTPPWIDPYFKLRFNKSNDDEIGRLRNFFNCMHYGEMGYHLAGDLLKIDKKNISHMPLIFGKMRERKIINKDFEDFIDHAKSIITIENEREEADIFLL